MKIAVIGATGMIGHHTARAIVAAGHGLHVIHRESSNLTALQDLDFTHDVADLDDQSAMSQALSGMDAVINCAGYYPTEPRPWQEEVEKATGQMTRFYSACAAHELQKIVYLGGSIGLRRKADGTPGDETCDYPGQPANRNPYLQVKWAMDAQARQKAEEGLPVVVGIPSMTFGEYDQGPTTGRLIVEIANQTLPAYVRGNRNAVYAGDAGRGLLAVCEQGRPGERYLLTGENLSMDELVALIARVTGVQAPRAIPLAIAKVVAFIQTTKYRMFGGALPRVDPTAIAVMSAGQFLDGSKAQQELGFKAEVSVEEAVRRAFTWFRQNGYIKQRE